MNQISTMKDSEKIVETLSKMINTTKNLEHLACEHNIQARLYSGMDLTESLSCLEIIVLQDGYQTFVKTPTMIKNCGQS